MVATRTSSTTSPAAKAWYEGDKKLYGMDGPTALAFCFKKPCPKGIEWALELPRGEEFVDWLLDERAMPDLFDQLSATYDAHFRGRKRSPLSFEQFAEFVALMSNRRWRPGGDLCESLIRQQKYEGR